MAGVFLWAARPQGGRNGGSVYLSAALLPTGADDVVRHKTFEPNTVF